MRKLTCGRWRDAEEMVYGVYPATIGTLYGDNAAR